MRRGFTLIELLVVIAIIGVLSAVIIASLSQARARGSDAAVEANLATIRVEAEIYYAQHHNYGPQIPSSVCTNSNSMFQTDTTILNAMSAADSANGSAGQVKCAEQGTSYVIGADLVSASGNYWCVDSSGNSKKVPAGGASPVQNLANNATACP